MASASTTTSGKLPLRTKLAYGSGDLGAAIVSAINGFYLNAFLLQVAQIDPVRVGIIFLLVKIWDAVNDPMMGAIIDRTQTRWGRRRPWLLIGAIPFGVAFFMHWIVPPLDETGKFFYYLFVAILLDTAFTVVNVAYTSLTPALTQDYDERTNLNSYRFSFSILGSVTAATLHLIIVNAYPDDPAFGNMIAAGIWTIFIIVPNFITFAFTTEPEIEATPAEEQFGFFEGIFTVFSNRSFVLVTIIYLLSWLCVQFVQANLLLYVQYWISPEATSQFPIFVLEIQLTSFVFVWIWGSLSKRIGKQMVYYLGAAIWMIVSLALFFVPRGAITPLYIISPLAGIGVAIALLIPWSMLPDVIEQDELETGKRREGIFYGFFVFLQKLGISLGLAFSNFALAYAGFDQALTQQPESVSYTLRIFVSLVPVFILLISFIPVYLYPITKERHTEIRAKLAEQKANR